MIPAAISPFSALVGVENTVMAVAVMPTATNNARILPIDFPLGSLDHSELLKCV
jgi:hypothetical protein